MFDTAVHEQKVLNGIVLQAQNILNNFHKMVEWEVTFLNKETVKCCNSM